MWEIRIEGEGLIIAQIEVSMRTSNGEFINVGTTCRKLKSD